jgi:EmrB/QacA subfamily drug resistance transporter
MVEATPRAGSTRLTALIVACALFMQNLDSTVVSTALPTMARAFGADPLHMNVALTSYILSLAVFIPVSGWTADRFGSRTVFRAAIAVFTVGSVLCGRATNLPFLVAARILQGAGGALMVPVGRLLLLRAVAKTELVAAMAWLTMPALIGPVVGPPIGGFIVTYAHWPLIFDLNVPIGLLGIALVTRYVAEVREPSTRRLDVRGLALSSVALGGLMIGLETAGRGVLPGVYVAGLLGAGVLASASYAWHAQRHPEPLLDFGLMRLPTFAVSVVAGSLFRVGIGAIPFLLPLMLQLGFGQSAAQSGMITFASSAGALAMKPIATRTLRRFGFRATLIWNAALSAAFLGTCALFRPSWPLAAIYAVLLVGGFVRSLQFTSYNTIAYADIPRERMSAATSLYSTLQQVSLALGITAGAATLEIATAVSGHARPTLMDFSVGFAVITAVALLAAPAATLLPSDAGDEMTGHAGVREDRG